MAVKYIILGLLNYKPMHGYEIKQIFEQSVSYVWTINYGQLYPLLKSMEQEGLIEKKQAAQENKRTRIVYQITGDGQQEFSKWLSDPVTIRQVKDEFYLKVMFFSYADKEAALPLINRQLEAVEEQYHELQSIKKEHGAQMDKFLALYLEAGIMRFETDLRWLNMVKAELGPMTGEDIQ